MSKPAGRIRLMMRTLITGVFGTILLLAAAEFCSAMDWHGLTPLRSTRQDVIRLLNQCTDQKEACVFRLGEEDVYIRFSSALAQEHSKCVERLPPETIVFIDVELTTPRRFKDLKLDKKKFEKFNPIDLDGIREKGFKGYWLANEGLLVNEMDGKIIELGYIGTPDDRSVCSDFYAQPKSFIKVVWVHFAMISIDCKDEIRAGEVVVFTAFSTINARRGYQWVVTAGRIVSGQNTDRITVDTSGLTVDEIVATAEFGDVFRHTAAANCRVKIKKAAELEMN